MNFKTSLLRAVNAVLRPLGLRLMRSHSLYDWQVTLADGLSPRQVNAGPEAGERLAELERRYREFDKQVTTAFEWPAGTVTAEHLRNFRGDNPYIWQRIALNANDVAYALTYYFLKSRTPLLDKLTEDGAFGVRAIEIDGRLVSRDLLDSVSEVDFLIGQFGNNFSILDIGAGYGRLAHRLSEATDARIAATDAFAPSTFLSEYYLAERNSRATVIPLDEVERVLSEQAFDVATNIHSFSECRLEAIDWWISRLAAAKVEYLFIVPNGGDGKCLTNDGKDMDPVFARHGYEIAVRQPRHADPIVQRYGLDPAWFHLYRLTANGRAPNTASERQL